jgi:hypothetical protein
MSRRLYSQKRRFLFAAFLFAPVWFLVQPNLAQSNQVAVASNAVTSQIQQPHPPKKDAREIRAACIVGRRIICGRVLEVTHDGIVVDSGYTSIMQPPFNHSWVVPAETAPKRPTNILEGTAPDSPCVGLVFLTDIPRRPPVHQYDYVIIHGYPAGTYDYKPLKGISKNIRRFSAGLEKAVELNLRAPEL